MKKRVEILIVEDYSGNPKISEQDIKKSLSHISDNIIVSRIHVPQWDSNEEENGIVGVHIIVREIAET